MRQRLLNRAKAKGDDDNLTLPQFAIERFHYRLRISVHKWRFVLKGASLFCLRSQERHRASWDLGLLGGGGGTVSIRSKPDSPRGAVAAPHGPRPFLLVIH